MSKFLLTILTGGVVLLRVSPPTAAGQIRIGPKNTRSNGIVNPAAESFTVTVTSGAAISFALKSNTATNSGSNTTTVTTSWITLRGSRTAVAVWAYFSSATSALVHQNPTNTVNIPSTAVMIQINGSGQFTALTSVSPFGGAASGLRIANVSINAGNRTGSVTNTLAYNIDTTKVPQLPADTYVGTLNIQAQATP
jgi:hypothetical protein